MSAVGMAAGYFHAPLTWHSAEHALVAREQCGRGRRQLCFSDDGCTILNVNFHCAQIAPPASQLRALWIAMLQIIVRGSAAPQAVRPK
eukprot:11156905-Lingulodinium_polyedra.AAC.1